MDRHDRIRPTERFLLVHRIITFFDEWLFYLLLVYLYVNQHITALIVTASIGGLFIIISYLKQWYMEAARFEVEEE